MSKQPTNPAHQFPGAKELASLPPDIQSRLMLSLQGQAPKKNYPTHHTLIHPPPDMSDLNMFQPSKKLKTDDNTLNMLLDPQAAAAMSLFPGFASANKQQIEIPSVQEPLIVPELRPLGFDAQSQALRQGKGRNPATGGFPGFESQARGQMSQLAEAGFPGLGSLLPGAGAEDLLMSSQNLAREQALKNMLLMQALQNPNDILTNRLLQAQAQQQAQAQLLGHPSYQLQQSMRLPGYNGVNPMTLQYLELQKRLQNDLALMQAQAQAAQAMQAAQRMQGPSQSLSESLNGRFRMEGLPGENLIKLESGLQFPLGLDPQLRMLYNEQLGGQKRRDDIPELYERLARDAEVKREDIGAQLGLHQQQQQSLRQQQQRHEEKLQQQQQQQQLKKNGEKAMNGFAQVEREVRPQKEARIEQPKIEQKVAPRNEPRIDPMEEELKGRSVVKTTAARGKPVREVPVVAPKPVRNVPPQQPLTVNPRSARDTRESRDARERESRRTSSRLQGSQIKYDLDSEEEEEKVMPVTRSNNARNTRSSNRKQDTTPTQVKPVVINVHVPSTMIKSTPQEKGPTIIQPKEQFTAKFFGDYLIEVYLRKENIKTNFKRTPLGRAHQIYVHDCTLNDDEEEDDLPMRKPCNLISAPVYNPEDEVEEIQLIPHTETPGPHVIKAKEIKVGEDHQAYIPELNLNAQMELHQRPLKLLVSPNNV